MPQPTGSQVHVDSILTNISVAYMQNADNFIASKVFPIVPVDKQSDKYFTYTKGDWFRDEAAKRAGGTESVGSGYGLSTGSYSCDVFAIHKDVDDQTTANADNPLNPKREATEFVTNRLLLRQEKQWVTDYFAGSVWGNTDQTGVASSPSTNQFVQWSDYTSSDPIEDIEAGKETILSTTGFEANTLVLGYSTFRQLRNHPDFVDRVKYTSAQNISADMLGAVFEVPRVFVAKSVINSAAEGATASYGFAHGKGALLMHVAASPSTLTPSAGYTFAWRGVSGGLGEAVGVKDFRMEHLASDRVEGEVAFDNKVVASDLGLYFASAVA